MKTRSGSFGTRPRGRSRRGASLILVMLIVAVMTLLVAGSISLTGSERAAAVEHSRGEEMSGCIQAARNMFFARVRALGGGDTFRTVEDIKIPANPAKPGDDGKVSPELTVATAHYTGSASTSLTNVRAIGQSLVGGSSRNAADLSNRVGISTIGKTYLVTARCREERSDRESEVEFAVRLGL